MKKILVVLIILILMIASWPSQKVESAALQVVDLKSATPEGTAKATPNVGNINPTNTPLITYIGQSTPVPFPTAVKSVSNAPTRTALFDLPLITWAIAIGLLIAILTLLFLLLRKRA